MRVGVVRELGGEGLEAGGVPIEYGHTEPLLDALVLPRHERLALLEPQRLGIEHQLGLVDLHAGLEFLDAADVQRRKLQGFLKGVADLVGAAYLHRVEDRLLVVRDPGELLAVSDVPGGVVNLLADAGVSISQTARSYRPHVTLPGCEVKILKPQSIVEMLHMGSRDVGFTGMDWVAELDGELVQVLLQRRVLPGQRALRRRRFQ